MAKYDDLHTGSTGVDLTFGNEDVNPEVEEVIAEQQRELQDLLPSVKQIIDVIDDEIAAVCDIRAYMRVLPEGAAKEDIEAEYRGRELFIGMAERLKSSIAERVADSMEINQ